MKSNNLISYSSILKTINSSRSESLFVIASADDRERAVLLASEWHLPNDYVEFLRQVGPARLFRDSNGAHLLEISAPCLTKYENSGFVKIGFADSQGYLFLTKNEDDRYLMAIGSEQHPVVVGLSFHDWIHKAFTTNFEGLDAESLREYRNGIRPFSKAESILLEERSKIAWEILGKDDSGNVFIKIINNSRRLLPFISLGIFHKGTEVGLTWINTTDIKPGTSGTKILKLYKHLPTQEQEIRDLWPPRPWERKRFKEFALCLLG